MGTAFFPLDEQLDLPATGLLPHAHQTLVRLGSWMPFEQASRELKAIGGIDVSPATVRRQTLEVGKRAEQVCTHEAAVGLVSAEAEKPARRMAMGSDGGMVPLRGGVWAEVKTLVIGQVLPVKQQKGGRKTTAHSYFSRLTDAHTFADLASAEIARRGIPQAQDVCAIQDGAQWLQGFVDGHRRDAVRILDFAHAAEYLAAVAEQGREAGVHVPGSWLDVVLHHLKHQGPERVMKHLHWWHKHRPNEAVREAVRYFGKRLPQMQYPQFQAQGWPIGSGMVESANKIVMQARLKGAGMHWEAANVNPMLALRTAICNDRWAESWRHQQRVRKEQRHAKRQQRVEERRTRLLRELKTQVLRWFVLLPSVKPVPPPPQRKGRTEGQRRWGRQTFSPKALSDASAKI